MRRALLLALVLLAVTPALAHAAPPPNDDFENAEMLTGPIPIQTTGTNAEATLEPGEPDPHEAGASVWYGWTPVTADPATVDLCASDYDTVLAIYTGDELLNLTNEETDDDGCADGSSGSKITVTSPTPGATYWIAVDGFRGSTGTIDLKIRQPRPPANDDFADAETVTGESPIAIDGTNEEASKEPGEPDHAGDRGGASVWYRWTAPEDGRVEIDNCSGRTIGGPLAVYTGTAVTDLTEVVSGELNAVCGFFDGTRVAFKATAGQTYLIAADGALYGTAIAVQGSVGLNLLLTHPPANDDFADAEVLGGALPITVDGSNEEATKETGEPDHGNPGGASVWYRWTPETATRVTIDTCGGDLDTVLVVYTGDALDDLTSVAGNDDGCGAVGAGSRVTLRATAGETYRILIDGYSEFGVLSTGAFKLALRDAGANPPSNDNFGDAEPITGALPTETHGTTDGASKEPDEPNHAGNVGGGSVWYRWTAPANDLVTVDTCDADFDTLLAVYTGDAVGGLTVIGSDDDGCGPLGAGGLVTFMASAGETYRIAVDGFSPTPEFFVTGQVVLRIARGNGRPANDNFDAAEPLTGALPVMLDRTNFRATEEPDEPDHAGQAGVGSVWYRWTATEDRKVTLDVCDADFDSMSLLAVYTGPSVDDLDVVESRRATSDTNAFYSGCRVSFRAISGTTYRIAVDAEPDFNFNPFLFRRYSGHRLELRPAQPPVNDDFADAKALTGELPLRQFGHNVEATKEPGEPVHAGDPGGASVWYRYTPSVTAPVTVSICPTNFDNLVAVYTGDAVNDLELVTSNAFGCEVSFRAHAGETYSIAVDGFRTAAGSIARGDVLLDLLRSHPPANDEFADAEELDGPLPSHTTGSNREATKSALEPQHAEARTSASVWYRWTAGQSATVAVDVCGSAFDTLLDVYTGPSEGELTPVAGNDEGCGGGHGSRVTFGATAGTTYHISVDGNNNRTGSIDLRIVAPPAAGATAACAPGQRAVGGGGGAVSSGLVRHTVEATAPVGFGELDNGETATGWQTTMVNHTEAAEQHKVFALCSATADATIARAPLDVPANGVADGVVTCPEDTRAVGGGIAAPGTRGLQHYAVRAAAPVTDTGNPFFARSGDVAEGWFGSMANYTDQPARFDIYALCSATSDATLEIEQFGALADPQGWAVCPPGRRAVGGGVYPLFHGGDDTIVQSSAPVNAGLSIAGTGAGDVAKAWSGSAVDDKPGGGGTVYRVEALCSATSDAIIAAAPFTAPPSRPQHDDFADAHPLDGALPLRVGGTNERATREPGEPVSAEASVWYRWTATEDQAVVVGTCPSDFDTTLAVYTGATVNQLTEVAADDDACGKQSQVTFLAHTGQTYRIAVDGHAGATGKIVLRIHSAGPPVNDNLADATPVSGPLPLRVSGVNLLATKEPGEPDHAGDPGGASAWFSWTATADGPVSIDTCRSDFDTALAVYAGTAMTDLTEVAGNDDNCGVRSRVAFKAGAGRTYLIAVDGQDGESGTITLQISTAFPPVNDDVEHPEPLAGDGPIAIDSSNEDATRQPGEPDHGGRGGASMWYRWTPSSSGPVAVETCGSSLDTLIGVYQGNAVDALTPLGTDDNACGPGSRVAFTATVGQSYLIALDGHRGAVGSFTLRIEPTRAAPPAPQLDALPPANDNHPRITGVAPGAQTVRLYADPACAGAAGWTGAAADLEGAGIAIDVADDSSTLVTARAVSGAGNASACSAPATVVEDSTAPAVPVINGVGSGRATGTAEPDATVELFANTFCGGPAAAGGTAGAFASPGLAVSAPDNATTRFTARAVDRAGNASGCSAPVAHANDSAPHCAGKVVTIQGTARSDVIRGTAGRDVIAAGAGDDAVRGLRGGDVICGGAGDDTIRGGNGDDDLRGGAGHDRLVGGPGHDTFHGGRAADPERRKQR